MTFSRTFPGSFSLLAALCLAGLTGCGEGTGTVPVTGTVTLDGQPLSGAAVVFAPPRDSPGTPARGTTDASGNFALTTFAPKDGAIPATYDVGVSKTEGVEDAPVLPEDEAERDAMLTGAGMTAEEMMSMERRKPKSLIPDKYANPKRSGISIEVTKGMDPVSIELVSE
jgi:hypothetical protein